MSSETKIQRKRLDVTVLVETQGTDEQIDRTMRWVVNQIKGATQWARGTCVAVSVRDAETGESLGLATVGESATPEMNELITQMVREENPN